MLLATAPLLLAGCEDSTQPVELPSRPLSPPPAVPLPPPVQAAPGFPALTRAGEIYMGAEDIYDFFASYHGGKLVSRFVFYADSTFGLQFSSLRFGFFEYGGRYTRADSIISFDWDGWSSAGKWGATGTLRGDELSVKYNLIMALTDFIDGVYLRVRATP